MQELIILSIIMILFISIMTIILYHKINSCNCKERKISNFQNFANKTKYDIQPTGNVGQFSDTSNENCNKAFNNSIDLSDQSNSLYFCSDDNGDRIIDSTQDGDKCNGLAAFTNENQYIGSCTYPISSSDSSLSTTCLLGKTNLNYGIATQNCIIGSCKQIQMQAPDGSTLTMPGGTGICKIN